MRIGFYDLVWRDQPRGQVSPRLILTQEVRKTPTCLSTDESTGARFRRKKIVMKIITKNVTKIITKIITRFINTLRKLQIFSTEIPLSILKTPKNCPEKGKP